MFERFTRPAREAVVRAKIEADLADSRSIALQFLLLGVLETADGNTAKVLREAGFDATEVRRTIRGTTELGDEDAQALKSIGIDLDAIRASLADSFGEGALRGQDEEPPEILFGRKRFGHSRFSREAKKALELALRYALARREKSIGAEHLLLGVLTCAESDELTEAIIEAKLPVTELKARLLAALDAAA